MARPFHLKLDGNCYTLAKKFGRKVRTIRPCERVICEGKGFELLNIVEWAKNLTHQLSGKIHFSFRTVTEPYPNHIVSNVSSFKNVQKHCVTPMGQLSSMAACLGQGISLRQALPCVKNTNP